MNFVTIQCFLSLISNWYTQLELHFLSIWVVALAAWPEFVLFNLQTFLSDGLKYSLTSAAEIVNAQNGSTALFGIVGAIMLDRYLTHYGMIFISSLFYSTGLYLLAGVSYHLDGSDGDYIIKNGKHSIVRWLLGIGLSLITVGKFSLTYSATSLSGKRAATPLTLIDYIVAFFILFIFIVKREVFKISSPKQFLIPAILMCLVTVVSLLYLKAKFFMKPMGERRNPLKYVLRVYMAALLKHRLPSPQDPNEFYYGNPEHPLKHSNRKRFLEKAAIKETSEPERERKRWLCTLTEVEESKRLLHMAPICMAFLSYGLVKSIGDTFFLEQADQMDQTIGRDQMYIPLQSFLILAKLSNSASKRLYKVFISKRLVGSGKRYAPAVEYAMGMVLATLCCSVASWVAMEIYTSTSLISVFWLTPQFILSGTMDGLAGKGIEEFFSGELPSSMKNYDTVFAEGIVGAGTFCSIILVSVTNAATRWFSGEYIRLDRFYHLCTVIGTSIFFGYSYAAVRYYYQDDQEAQVADVLQQEVGDVEAAEHVIDTNQASPEEMEEAPEDFFIHEKQLHEEQNEQRRLQNKANSRSLKRHPLGHVHEIARDYI